MQVNQSRQTQPKVGILAISLSATVVVVVWIGETALNTGGQIEIEGHHKESQVKMTVSGTDSLASDGTDDMGE